MCFKALLFLLPETPFFFLNCRSFFQDQKGSAKFWPQDNCLHYHSSTNVCSVPATCQGLKMPGMMWGPISSFIPLIIFLHSKSTLLQVQGNCIFPYTQSSDRLELAVKEEPSQGRVYWTSQSHPLALRPTPLGRSLPSTQVATVRLLSKIHQSSLKKTLLFKMSFKWRLCWGCLDHNLSRKQLAARPGYLLGVWPVYLQGSVSRRAQCLN